uniref:Mesoderm induction early response protein 1 n=1 Tax=Syphacia muris TaxID=451379 RepID=A0A0N5AI46_9BILA
MAEEERLDSSADDYYDDGEEVYDDEATLDEEEMLEGGEDYEEELKILEDDANLPVEELRRRYYGSEEDKANSSLGDEEQSSSGREVNETSSSVSELQEADKAGPSSASDVERKTDSHGYFSDVEDTEEDADYVPPDPWRRDIREGPAYQASVPDLPSYETLYSGQERGDLLWSPNEKMTEERINFYLMEFYKLAFKSSESSKTADLSRALMDAEYNVEKALVQYPYPKVNAPKLSAPSDPIKWTEQECQLFEDGLRSCGKNFSTIQSTKLPHRTVGELVNFYYFWKKTERHDIFVNKTDEQQHPNCTDFMSRFIGHMDATTGDSTEHLTDSIDFTSPSIPPNLDIMNTKAWSDCWPQQNDTSPLPHLDNDTIANVLQ